MQEQNLDLTIYADVSTQADVIYRAVLAKDMPRTSDPAQYFPDAALARFNEWIGLGCPQ